MARQFPLIINNIAFLINPRQFDLAKALTYGNVDTQSGRKYQIWYDQPDTLTITGKVYGTRAYSQLLTLKQHYEGFENISTLSYKTTSYRGFIPSFSITPNVEPSPLLFDYHLVFQLLFEERFKIEDFTIIPATAGPIAKSLNRAIEDFRRKLGIKISGFTAAHPKNIFAKTTKLLGKSLQVPGA